MRWQVWGAEGGGQQPPQYRGRTQGCRAGEQHTWCAQSPDGHLNSRAEQGSAMTLRTGATSIVGMTQNFTEAQRPSAVHGVDAGRALSATS